jgi:AI-2 transport protein TqsA
MPQRPFTESVVFKTLCIVMLVGFIIFGLIFFKELLKPIAVAILLWYLMKAFNGLIEKIKIRKKPLNHWIRRAIALLAIVVLVEGSIKILVANVNQIIVNYPAYQITLNSLVDGAGNMMGMENFSQSIESSIRELDIEGFLKDIVRSTSAVIGNIMLVVVYAIFLVLEENSFVKKLSLVFRTKRQAERISMLLTQVYYSTNKYMTVKAVVSVLTATLSYIILVIAGVDFALLWALLIFGLNFIPYVGSLIATMLPALFSILQFGSVWTGAWIFGSIMAVQLVIGNYVEPRVMGKSLNLSPLVVLITLSFWGSVWGLLGMLLSVPFTSIMLITFAQFPSTRGLAIMLTENGDIESLKIQADETLEVESA